VRDSENRSVHTYSIGKFNLTVVNDGFATVPLSPEFVRGVPPERVRQALAKAGLPTDMLTTTFAPVLLEVDGRRVLFDTGLGPDAAAEENATRGMLVQSLAAIGISPTDIDTVVITHFHADHVNGLISRGEPVYPNADVLVPRIEWEFWMDDSEQANASPGRMQTLFANNRRVFSAVRERIRRYDWNDELFVGVTAVGTPGHSIGHTSFDLVSGGKRLFLQADLTNHAALFLPHPDWAASFDQDPQQAVATRMKVYSRLATEGTPLQAYHHPFPGLCRLHRDGDGFRREPLEKV
jgi:glyoxylase-like metal-dependent hydrolase (beta-lactamase superfamily II)